MYRMLPRILWCQLLVTFTTGSVIPNHPAITTILTSELVRRGSPTPSPYPYGTSLPSDFSWLGWDPSDNGTQKADAIKIYDAYDDMINMNSFALAEVDKRSAIFRRWFDEKDAENVKNVLRRIFDPKRVGNAAERMKNWVCQREDRNDRCRGSTGAWSISEKGIFHLCLVGLARPNARDIQCSDLDKTASPTMKSLAFTMLHEALHWIEVGDAALGKHITDRKNDAFGCLKLSGPDKLTNAQNYAFFAAEAYYQSKLNCTFGDPEADTKDTDEENLEFTGNLHDTMAINIIYRTDVHDAFTPLNAWYFYETPVGTSAICTEDNKAFAKFDAPNGQRDPSWPNGTYVVKPFGMDCEYKNNNENAGALWCKERDGPIQCWKEHDMERKGCWDSIYHKAYVYCQWLEV